MKHIIDLLPERAETCLLVKEAFSVELCERLIHQHRASFQSANLNYPTSYRNNERQIRDDTAFAETLFAEIQQHIPDLIEIDGISDVEAGRWELLGLNDRLRICRYKAGQYFNKHLDGVHYKSAAVQSKLTFMIYLNGGHGAFEGGRTLFFDSKQSDEIIGHYTPCKGDLIIFDHNLWHSGEQVSKGEKYILRSDIVYRRLAAETSSDDRPFGEGHLGYIWKILETSDGYITAGRDRLIKFWDRNGQKMGAVSGHTHSILGLLCLDEDRLISCSRDRSVRIWERQASGPFEETRQLMLHQSTVLGLARVSDSAFMSCGADGRLHLISRDGNLLAGHQAHQEWIWAVEALDEKTVVSIGEGGWLKIWSLYPFALKYHQQFEAPLTAMTYDAEEGMLYVGREDGRLMGFRLGHADSLTEVFNLSAHTDKIWTIKTIDHFFASGGEDNQVIVWQKKGRRKIKVTPHKNFVQDLVLTSDKVVSVSYDGEVKVQLLGAE